MRRPANILVLLAALALALPAAASASPAQVIRDCAQDGDIDGNYSEKDLRQAERDMPSDIDEYYNCREAIQAARERKRSSGGGGNGGNGGGGSGGSPTAGGGGTAPGASPAASGDPDPRVGADPADVRDLASATRATAGDRPPPRLDVGGREIAAGGQRLFDVATGANDLPPVLIAAIAAIALASLAATAVLLRRRIPTLPRVQLPFSRR